MIYSHSKPFSLTSIVLSVILLSGCASLPDNSHRLASYYNSTTTDQTALGQASLKREQLHPGESGSYPLSSGLDAFVARAVAASYAEQTLDVQYYLYHNDTVGALLTDQLLKAADRGVRVRVLLDDMDLSNRDFGAAIIDAHPNIEIRIFNPFGRNTFRNPQYVTRFGSVTRRMHNKSFTIDNQLSIIGGRNIGDEYFDASMDYTFSDLDVLLIGPVVDEVSKSFDLYWNNAIVYPLSILVDDYPNEQQIKSARENFDTKIAALQDSDYLKALQNSELAKIMRQSRINYYWSDVEIIYDHPEKVIHSRDESQYHLSADLNRYFNAVNSNMLLISPYFVPGKSGVAFLTDLESKGIEVTVVTNSLASNDVPAVHAGYMKYRKKLLAAGVQIYEFKTHTDTQQNEEQQYGQLKSGLHAKSFVLDDNTVFIGSLNLDPRSAKENTEIGAMIKSPALAKEFKTLLYSDIGKDTYEVYLENNQLRWRTDENGKEVIFEKEPETSWWERFSVGAMRLIPAESQL